MNATSQVMRAPQVDKNQASSTLHGKNIFVPKSHSEYYYNTNTN